MDDRSFRKRKKLIKKKIKNDLKINKKYKKKQKKTFSMFTQDKGLREFLTVRQPEKQLIVCKTISNFSRPLSFGMRLSKHGISHLLLL